MRHVAFTILLVGLLFYSTAPTSADDDFVFQEVTGRINLESRYFPQHSLHDGQREQSMSLVAEPEVYIENEAAQGLLLKPFFRYDSADASRTHWDLREAYGLFYGEFEDSEWELRIGLDKVFWGVVEARHIVDIINQTDLIENPNQEEKLGQPMVHATWLNDLGTFEAFVLPYFRKRAFQSRTGRLRNQILIDSKQSSFESAAQQRHLDVAARYSHSINILDLGLSIFDGTNRNPTFTLGLDPGGDVVLLPLYEQIRQYGVDAQITTGAWLLKFEGTWREGERNSVSLEEDFLSLVSGFEYTWYSIHESDIDLGLLMEFLYDGRDQRATVATEEDLFVAARLAFNDEASTDVLFGIQQDLDKSTRNLFIEANRRLDNNFSLGLEGTAFLNIDTHDSQFGLRKDSYLQLDLTYHF